MINLWYCNKNHVRPTNKTVTIQIWVDDDILQNYWLRIVLYEIKNEYKSC